MKLIKNTLDYLAYNLPYSRFRRYVLYYILRMRRRNANDVKTFLGEDVSPKVIRHHQRKMRHAYLRDSWNGKEYFLYRYESLSRKGRKEYVTDIQKDMVCSKINPREVFYLFGDKVKTYHHFKPFFKRDVCEVTSSSDVENFRQFIVKHQSFIIKPTDSCMGWGVKVIHDATADSVSDIMADYPKGLIAEELIVQHPVLSSIYPNSVNTVRLTTWVVDNETHFIRAFIRFGRGGNVVDNAAQGGLFGAVDLNTGVVLSACDEWGNRFVSHPDTHKMLVGFQIPMWEEAKRFAEELSKVYPRAHYVGWDLACTENGWVMVEGNSRAQLICQQTSFRSGIANELKAISPTCLKPSPFLKKNRPNVE